MGQLEHFKGVVIETWIFASLHKVAILFKEQTLAIMLEVLPYSLSVVLALMKFIRHVRI